MFDHSKCDHPSTKVARAACRRAHTPAADKVTGKTSGARRGTRLPSMIAPKLRPVIDHARDLGLKIRVITDPPEGVEQGFVIMHPKRPDCQLIAEAFASARKGIDGKAEFYHVEDNRSRQLSRQRAVADLDKLATR